MAGNRITILHDSFGKRADLRKDWGFAALVEFNEKRILFDTGNNAQTFAENTSALGVDLGRLDLAAISHRHGDHTSGLNHLLKRNSRIQIYTPDELYGVFGSSLPGLFYPRCHSLPPYMQYYDGKPPQTIRHGSPWPEAQFTWVKETREIAIDVWLLPAKCESFRSPCERRAAWSWWLAAHMPASRRSSLRRARSTSACTAFLAACISF